MKFNKINITEDPDWPDDNEIATEQEKSIAEDIFNLIQSLINEDLNEEYISLTTLSHDFNRHCIVNNSKSSYTSVKYDFTDINRLGAYENKISEQVLNTSNTISSLFDTEKILKLFRKLFEGTFSILFWMSCGFTNAKGPVKVGINNSNSDNTTNYLYNTVNLIILSDKNKTISMYPIDAHYLETKINNIIKNHSDIDTELHFNND